MRFVAPRSARTIAGVGLSALLVASLVSGASISSTADSTLVGTPRAVLIENQHAAGKVLEIGNDLASLDSAPTVKAPAAAASFTIAATPEGIQAQRVLVYPVLDVPNAVLLANADGELLVRRANAGSDFRYLSVSTMSLDDAAVDPYAQWNLVDAGNGLFAITNVQRDSSNRVASLDMYNWANANGAEVQTYDAGTAAVQRWRIHSLDPVVTAPATRVLTPGTVPAMPASIPARYSWGLSFPLTSITWSMPDDSVWNVDGTITVDGLAVGYFGESIAVTAAFTLGSLGDPADSTLSTYAGVSLRQVQMQAPRELDRPVSGSETTVRTTVTWDWSGITDADFAAPGTVTVPAADGQGFAATLRIEVGASASTNLLRGIPSHAVAVHADGGINLTNGSRTGAGFGDWRSGGAGNRVNPNTVTMYLDSPQQVTGVGVFDLGGTNNIGTVRVQVRDARGGWVDFPARDTTWPVTNATSGLELVVESDPILVTALRVTLTHKGTSTWMTLSEIELYGPSAAS